MRKDNGSAGAKPLKLKEKHMNVALILSGGSGVRLGADIPKQYIEINGRPIISCCMEQIFGHARIDAVQIVADSKWHGFIDGCLEKIGEVWKFRGYSSPGENRQLSIYNGLQDIKTYADEDAYVFIHDAARPVLSEKLIEDSFQAIAGHDGVLPVLPMKDTVYLSKDGRRISSLLDRGEVYAGQAPETFVLGKYLEANKRLLPDRIKAINGSTEPAILAGLDVVMIPGDENNFKITTKEDLDRFR